MTSTDSKNKDHDHHHGPDCKHEHHHHEHGESCGHDHHDHHHHHEHGHDCGHDHGGLPSARFYRVTISEKDAEYIHTRSESAVREMALSDFSESLFGQTVYLYEDLVFRGVQLSPAEKLVLAASHLQISEQDLAHRIFSEIASTDFETLIKQNSSPEQELRLRFAVGTLLESQQPTQAKHHLDIANQIARTTAPQSEMRKIIELCLGRLNNSNLRNKLLKF